MTEAVKPDRTLKINVSGTIFVIKPDIISKNIESPLTSLTNESPYYDVTEGAFCFSRDPDVFYSVLNYFRYGELHLPKFLCGNMIKKELEFWGIPGQSVSECCSSLLNEEIRQQQTEITASQESKKQGSTSRNDDNGIEVIETTGLRTRIWMTMENPDHSLLAKIWHNVYVCVVLLHACVFMIWNEEIVRVPSYLTERPHPVEGSQNTKLYRFFNMDPALGVLCIAILCNVFFSLELVILFAVSPEKLKFFRRLRNCINLALIVVTWFVLVVELTKTLPVQYEPFNMFYLLCTGLNSARLVLIFRVSRLNTSTRKLFVAFEHSCVELFVLILIFLSGVAIFGTIVYYIELYQNDFYTNILDSLWWAIVSMTTVGYGDMYPVSVLGRIFGSLCACFGVLMIAITVSVLTVRYGELNL